MLGGPWFWFWWCWGKVGERKVVGSIVVKEDCNIFIGKSGEWVDCCTAKEKRGMVEKRVFRNIVQRLDLQL